MSSADVIDYSAMMMPPPSETEASPETEAPPEDVPDGWQAKLSKSTGKWYYVHLKTQQAQWSPPPQPSSSSTSCPHPTEEARMQDMSQNEEQAVPTKEPSASCGRSTATAVKTQAIQAELQKIQDAALLQPGGLLVLE